MQIGKWKIKNSNRGYWIASAPEGEGLPLDVAMQMHERKYPDSEGKIKTYGEVIRSGGHCMCPSPEEYGVKHFDSKGLQVVLDPEDKEKKCFESILERHPDLQEAYEKYLFVSSLEGLDLRSVVDSYHIDTELGLDEFVRIIQEVEKAD